MKENADTGDVTWEALLSTRDGVGLHGVNKGNKGSFLPNWEQKRKEVESSMKKTV